MEFQLGDLLNFWPIALGLGLMLLPVRWRWWGAAIVAILLAAATVGLGAKEWFGLDSAWVNPYTVRIEAFICITAIMAVSLNLINGITGLFSIGHAGFMVVGAYTAGIMTSLLFRLTGETGLGLALPAFLLSLLAGGLAAAALGFLVGLPTLRLRGDYLAIATLGFGEIIGVLLKFITFHRVEYGQVREIGGPRAIDGIPAMPGPRLPGIAASDMPILMGFVFSILVLAGVVWAVRNFAFSSHGRACGAIREDEVAAEILGVDTVFYKVASFVMGAFFAGVGGGLLAHWSNMVHPSMGGFLKSIEFLIIIYIGGIGSISGSILAAAALTTLWELLTTLFHGADAWRMVIYGAILIAVILWRPKGLYGGKEFRWLVPRGRTIDDGR
jgi:branched-chain amino acid transport system permease protein